MYGVVQKVIALDAFARCWVHERVFYEAVGELISAPKKDAYARLFKAWEQENEVRFHAAMKLTAQQIASAARDSEAVEAADGAGLGTVLDAIGLGKQRDRKRHDKAMKALMGRLNEGIADTTAALLKLHRLDAGAAARINERVHKGFVVRAPVDTRQAGLLGAIVSGAATGLSADLMAGGLTLGAGALLGGVVGAMTFASAAWAFNAKTDRNEPRVQFSDEFLRTMVVTGLLRYLAVVHFGRGRGNFVEGEAPLFWQQEVESAVALNENALAEAWRAARAGADSDGAALEESLTRTASQVLHKLYPRP
ncbi:MAG: hypothetical protein JWQ00_247 [Noviherbaspirillum sp.]|nr:hypothetical protein [Noviherbaspirillum sp.]